MKEILDDNEIKALLEDFKEEDIPDLVEVKIKDSYKKLKRNKVRKNLNKGLVAASIAVLLIGISGFLVRDTAFAESILSKLSLFKEEEVSNYSTDLDVKAKDKGIELSIKEVAYDGNEIYIAYIIKSDEKLNIEDKEDKLYGLIPHSYAGRDIKISGGMFTEISGWGYLGNEKVDDNTFIAREELHLRREGLPSPKEISINQKIHKLAGVDGLWELDFKVNFDVMKDKYKSVKVNKTIKYGDRNMKIANVQITPITSRISMINWNLIPWGKDKKEFLNPYQYVIYDDKDRGLEKVGGGGSFGSLKESLDIAFKTVDSTLPDYIVITPIRRISKSLSDFYEEMGKERVENGELAKEVVDTYVKYGALDKLPIEINTKNFGSIKINKIDKKDDKIKLYLSITENKYLELFKGNIHLFDKKKGDKYNEHSYYGGTLKRQSDKEFILEVDGWDAKDFDINNLQNYEVTTINFDKTYEKYGEEVKIDIRK